MSFHKEKKEEKEIQRKSIFKRMDICYNKIR